MLCPKATVIYVYINHIAKRICNSLKCWFKQQHKEANQPNLSRNTSPHDTLLTPRCEAAQI